VHHVTSKKWTPAAGAVMLGVVPVATLDTCQCAWSKYTMNLPPAESCAFPVIFFAMSFRVPVAGST
jgi:hypothetical protein